MADIYNSCPNCANLRLLLEEKISEIEKLETQIKSLNKVLHFYEVRVCKNCNKEMESRISQTYEIDPSKTASSVHLKSLDIISFNSCEKENSEFLNLTQNSFNLENSSIRKSLEETENPEVYASTPVNEQKSSEEYIYDENCKMYYCISTGYYYDRNTGLYYVPQNGAYYTYDYTENAYVLYDGEKSVADPNGKNNVQQKLRSIIVGADDICESNKQEAEHKFELQENETCSKDWQTPAGTNLTVQDLVREVAEQHSGMSDYIYDENSCMYYSPSTGYYYDAVKNLLYDPQSGIYYKYDKDTCSYEFYHQIDLTDVAVSKGIKKKEQIESAKVKARRKYWRKKQDNTPKKCSKSLTQQEEDLLEKESNLQNENYSSPEEGELFSSDSEEEIENQSQVLPHIEDSSSACSPCIRAIVKNSEKLKTGTLILITCTGAVIGRDKCNTVFIPDTGVSKAHAEVRFVDELWKYSIKDLGSQNGTFVNDARLSQVML